MVHERIIESAADVAGVEDDLFATRPMLIDRAHLKHVPEHMLLLEKVLLLLMCSPDHVLDFEGLDRVVADTGVVQATHRVPVLLIHKNPHSTPPFLLVEDVVPEVLILLGVYQSLLVRGFVHGRSPRKHSSCKRHTPVHQWPGRHECGNPC